MSNFDDLQKMIGVYLDINAVKADYVSDLHKVSLNNDNGIISYVYDGASNLRIIDMDSIAQHGYRHIKKAKGIDNVVNTADAFLINRMNDWFFIEFKDSQIRADNSKLKNNILKKAYANWYMLLDILYYMKEKGDIFTQFDFENPVKFAKEHIHYIVVCSTVKNPSVYIQIKNHDLQGERYTPPFMERLKDYLFKEAYLYTEQFFEWKFVNQFSY